MIQKTDKSERTDISTSAEILSISYRLSSFPSFSFLLFSFPPNKACDEHLTMTKPRLHRQIK